MTTGLNRRQFIKEVGAVCTCSMAAASSLVAAKQAGPHETTATLLNGGISRAALEDAARLACRWLTNVAQVKSERLRAGKDQNASKLPYTNWKGAMRGEYSPARESGPAEASSTRAKVPARTWFFFCPIWHTGQAVKALSLAYRYFGDRGYLESARLGADFIVRHQNRDQAAEDFGCIAAYEDHNDIINTSAILECCGGLFELSRVTGDEQYAGAAVNAIQWVVRKLYTSNGLFTDGYDPVKRALSTQGWADKSGVPGRPLLDDGVLLTTWQRTRDEKIRRAFYETADRLIATEEPPGNWVNYVPSNWKRGSLHPRNAFWWGRPMWMAFKDSQDEKYRKCFERVCDWYVLAMRHDGGMLRNTYADFSTDSFGHATSAVGCACMMFHDSIVELGSQKYLENLALGLKYMMTMQVTRAGDPNMQGVIIEKVLAPGGSDAASWYVRDLGTIFFITAACLTLLNIRE